MSRHVGRGRASHEAAMRRTEERKGGKGCERHRGDLSRILSVMGIVIGLLVILYYPASEAVDAWRRGQIAETLDAQAESIEDGRRDELLRQAEAYNARLAGITPDIPSKDIMPYGKQLSADGNDAAFGYVTIPSIALTMPVYHGTSDAVLAAGVGHVEDTSLPVGGPSTHSVLSAHSGMEGMRAFDDIRELGEGSVFGVRVLGRLVCYRVYAVETVLPTDTSSLAIHAGEDLCTLVTCTPYGVNDHRLLVHGRRCEVPARFEGERPGIGQVLTNRRVLPTVAIAGAAAAIAAVAGVTKAVRTGRRKATGGRGPAPTPIPTPTPASTASAPTPASAPASAPLSASAPAPASAPALTPTPTPTPTPMPTTASASDGTVPAGGDAAGDGGKTEGIGNDMSTTRMGACPGTGARISKEASEHDNGGRHGYQ